VSQKGKFRYDTYLARQDIWSVCQNPSVTREAGRSGNFLLHVILEFKLRVNEQLAKLWNEPQASFMAGLLYGSRSSLPQSLTDNFSRTGVSHIIAVSGFNITIIGTVLGTLFVALGISRKKAFWWILGIIFLFVLFSGASSSVVRAGIMGSLVLVARRLGRMSRIGNVLIGTAALMTLLNPYVLVWDVGFQLSFLATIGLVYISPLFEKIVPTVKSPDWLIGLSETLLATLSAIIATLPLILFQFGRLSIVAPLVNVLVLWAVPWLMLLGFLALLLSCLYFPLGQGVAWLAAVGLKYVILVVSFFGSKSWAALDIQLPWWGMGVLYLGLIVVVAREQGKEDGHVELDNSKKV
jgi:competence protein ComEC